jgi:putative membrane protein
MLYLWLKAFHIAAAVTWIGGMLTASLAVANLSTGQQTPVTGAPPLLEAVRQWDRRVTSPVMLIVWGLGITMAMQGGWLSSSWLLIKLVIVVILSASHGLLSGTLRRRGRDAGRAPPAILRYAAPATIICVIIIAILAVTKPF